MFQGRYNLVEVLSIYTCREPWTWKRIYLRKLNVLGILETPDCFIIDLSRQSI